MLLVTLPSRLFYSWQLTLDVWFKELDYCQIWHVLLCSGMLSSMENIKSQRWRQRCWDMSDQEAVLSSFLSRRIIYHAPPCWEGKWPSSWPSSDALALEMSRYTKTLLGWAKERELSWVREVLSGPIGCAWTGHFTRQNWGGNFTGGYFFTHAFTLPV